MKPFSRDPVGTILALTIGLVIGLRTAQVVAILSGRRSYIFNSAAGTDLGFWITLAFVLGLGFWRLAVAPDGRAWPRLMTLAFGMLIARLVGRAFIG